MDEQPGQRPNPQQDEAIAFSIKVGGDQPAQAQPLAPATPVQAPPPLTPVPQTPPTTPIQSTPATAAAPGVPGPQSIAGNGPAQTPLQPGALPIAARLPVRTRGPLGRPFPLLLSLLAVVGSVVLLALVFGVRVLVLGGDWADGAATAGTVALALAVVFGLIALLRAVAGRRSLSFALLTIVLLVALAVTGAAGLLGSTPLHLAQAQAMEKSGQWGVAIREYGLSGQKGPNAPDIARVQIAWGEQLLQRNDYRGALTHFQIVLDDYQQSGDTLSRAQKGQFQAYVAWLKNDASHVPYREAITAFANYASSPNCASDCKATLAEVAPQAYYLYAVQSLEQKQYQLAVAEFGKLAALYGSSTYAKQGHSKAAAAYLGYGQQQINNQDCSGAVSSYKTIVTDYKDTPEATTAQNALNAPQDVSGIIANPPTNPAATAHLSKSMNFNAFFFSDEYSTTVDPKTGVFTFKLVAQGTYYLSMSHPVSGGTDYFAWPTDNTGKTFFSFAVTPLCPVQLGTFH